jgi:hypothetical protein
VSFDGTTCVLADVIPTDGAEAPWLAAVVSEAPVVDDQRPLQAALIAVMGQHSCRTPSLRTGILPGLRWPPAEAA